MSLSCEVRLQDGGSAIVTGRRPPALTERIEQWSESVLQLGQGTLYPALYRLERQDLITSEWRVTTNNRRARYYSLTVAGRRRLNTVLAQWRRVSRAINLVLETEAVHGGT